MMGSGHPVRGTRAVKRGEEDNEVILSKWRCDDPPPSLMPNPGPWLPMIPTVFGCLCSQGLKQRQNRRKEKRAHEVQDVETKNLNKWQRRKGGEE